MNADKKKIIKMKSAQAAEHAKRIAERTQQITISLYGYRSKSGHLLTSPVNGKPILFTTYAEAGRRMNYYCAETIMEVSATLAYLV